MFTESVKVYARYQCAIYTQIGTRTHRSGLKVRRLMFHVDHDRAVRA